MSISSRIRSLLSSGAVKTTLMRAVASAASARPASVISTRTPRPSSGCGRRRTRSAASSRLAAFVTLEGSQGEGSDELVDEIREHVAKRIGKFARPKRIIWADDLPKTRSGKIMRRLLRDIAEGRALGDVTTLRDPDVMAQLEGKINEEQAAEA